MDWIEEYEILPMHFLLRLTLNLNTWCISVEEESRDIDHPIISSLRVKLDRRTLDQPHMPPPETLRPVIPVLLTIPIQTKIAAPSHMPTQPHEPRGGRSR